MSLPVGCFCLVVAHRGKNMLQSTLSPTSGLTAHLRSPWRRFIGPLLASLLLLAAAIHTVPNFLGQAYSVTPWKNVITSSLESKTDTLDDSEEARFIGKEKFR